MFKIFKDRWSWIICCVLGFFCEMAAAQLPAYLNWYDQNRMHTEHKSSFLVFNAQDIGLLGDGIFDNAPILNDFLNIYKGTPLELFFPEGIYLFESSLRLYTHTTLRGQGQSSQLVFNCGEESHGIVIQGSWMELSLSLDSLSAGSLGTGTELPDGYYYLCDDDDALLVSPWAKNSTGHFFELRNKEMTIAPRRNFGKSKIWKVEPVSNVTMEQLSLVRIDATASQTSLIYVDKARDCIFDCLSLEQSNFALISINRSFGLKLKGCSFSEAHHYGNGGKGYGVALQFGTSGCVVENNRFHLLRHAVLLQAGANGNVIAHNHSDKPYWTEVNLPADASGDLVLHGNYVYANLFEGNVMANLVIDDSHGKNGPYNVFFKNRFEQYGVFMNRSIPSDSQVFISNQVTNLSFFKGLFSLAGKGHIVSGNVIKGKQGFTMPDLTPASMYLLESPDYFNSVYTWPLPMPQSIVESDELIPSASRLPGNKGVQCSDKETGENLTSTVVSDNKGTVFPNPFSDKLYISLDFESLKCYSIDGREVSFYWNGKDACIEGLRKGSYILKIQKADGIQSLRVICLQ